MDKSYTHVPIRAETIQAVVNVLSCLPYKDVAYVISLMQQDELEYQKTLKTEEK